MKYSKKNKSDTLSNTSDPGDIQDEDFELDFNEYKLSKYEQVNEEYRTG